MINSYPKVYAIGHAAIGDLFSDMVHIEEKIDGSQFSFTKTADGSLIFRSKNAVVLDGDAGMFGKAVEAVRSRYDDITAGYVYRCEYLSKPKHNTLAYDRTPLDNLILFDVNTGNESYMSYKDKMCEAEKIRLECVPILYQGVITQFDDIVSLLERDSVLGGQKIEGFVVKNYLRFSRDGKAMIGKYVSEKFKEIHGKDFKDRNPSGKEYIEVIAQSLRTESRWDKAIQHAREAGILEGDPKDIGKLIPMIKQDVKVECEEYIKDRLFAYAWPHIQRRITAGFPEYYKKSLAEISFIEGE